MSAPEILVTGGFDDLRPRQVRLLQEASRLGRVHVLLWSDNVICAVERRAPRFSEQERWYLIQALRYVDAVTLLKEFSADDPLTLLETSPADVWVVDDGSDRPQWQEYSRSRGIEYRVIHEEELQGFPLPEFRTESASSTRKRVIVTGCYDWFHSGHVRFFEEVATLGDLYAVIGHDANIRMLKGDGHPMFPQDVRRYMVNAVRYVSQTMISKGEGWMDAAPQIAQIRPDIYAVNEDGDRAEKRAFCEANGLQYVVLKRIPRAGLPPRQSTDFRGY
jgi:cytidyltransferase-like protein